EHGRKSRFHHLGGFFRNVSSTENILQMHSLGLLNGYTAGLHRQIGYLPDDVRYDPHVVLLVNAPHSVLDRGVVRFRRDVNSIKMLTGGAQILNRSVQAVFDPGKENQEDGLEIEVHVQAVDLDLGQRNVQLLVDESFQLGFGIFDLAVNFSQQLLVVGALD